MQVVEIDPQNELAWMWLSGLMDDLEDRIIACENVLTINPANEKVRVYLASLLVQKEMRARDEALEMQPDLKEVEIPSQSSANKPVYFDLYTNDNFWADCPKAGDNVDREVVSAVLRDPQIDVVHFAVHGEPHGGLVLKWSGTIAQRKVVDMLPGAEIRQMRTSQNKLVVSGACESSNLARDFIRAGAKAYVSPKFEIPWAYLGLMFQTFYAALQSGSTTEVALPQAVANYPDLASYEVYSSVNN